MKADDMMPLLTAWASRQRELTAQMEALFKVVGCSDGPLFEVVWGAWNDYTETLSRLIGDDFHWLAWYEQENRMGANGLEVRSIGGRSMKVRTLHQLAKLIAEGQPA
jgi:hypothetical protein